MFVWQGVLAAMRPVTTCRPVSSPSTTWSWPSSPGSGGEVSSQYPCPDHTGVPGTGNRYKKTNCWRFRPVSDRIRIIFPDPTCEAKNTNNHSVNLKKLTRGLKKEGSGKQQNERIITATTYCIIIFIKEAGHGSESAWLRTRIRIEVHVILNTDLDHTLAELKPPRSVGFLMNSILVAEHSFF